MSCSGVGSCEGGWWAFDFAQNNGVAHEETFPYDALNDECPKANFRASVPSRGSTSTPMGPKESLQSKRSRKLYASTDRS